jgi:RNA-directed DNA polymerase
MSLTTPESVWQLQEALRVKAKREPACRFHSLYDKLYRKDVLFYAWRCCRANGGAPGVAGVTFEQIESGGVSQWLEEL